MTGIGDSTAKLCKSLYGLLALLALAATALTADPASAADQLAKSSGGWFGVQIMDLSPESAAARGFRAGRGILVSSVVPGSPAARADLRAGDIVLEIDGRRIVWFQSMIALVQSRPPGRDVEVLLDRQGERLRTLVVLGDFEDAPATVLSADAIEREYQAGLAAYNADRHREAADIFEGLVDHGSTGARFMLALMYDNGWGRPLDHRQAAQIYRLASEQNLSSAQHNLALLYVNGEGVSRDLSHAYYWMKRAADGGDEGAQHNEGVLRPMLSSAEMAVAQEWLGYRSRPPSGPELERLQAGNREKADEPTDRPAVQQAAKPRSADPDVRQVQAMLSDLGYRPGPADGLMGARTRAAIKAFQRDRGLTADGRVDPSLVASLRSAKASTGVPAAAEAGQDLDELEELDDF